MMRRLSPVLLVLSVACGPQNAEMTSGTYTAFLPITTSTSLFKGAVDVDKADDSWAVDCRRLEAGETQLPGALDICDAAAWPPKHEQWLNRDGYYVVQEPLEPWRGEAVMTSEGDVQLTFHQRLPGGSDFRFAFVVDPKFEPSRCVQQEDGDVALEPIDGFPWLDKWSEDVDSGTLYYLNSGAYQFNPSNTDDVWTLPQEWRAGYASAKFAEEDLGFRRVRYGLPSAYSNYETEDEALDPADLFYVPLAADTDPVDSVEFQQEIARVDRVAGETTDELTLVGVDHFAPTVHTNEWRIADGTPAGLDGWVELHYAWVHFDSGSDLTIGGTASGDFSLVFDAFESQTRVFVTGEFDVKRIKRDRWVTDDVQKAKLEENGTDLCGVSPEDL